MKNETELTKHWKEVFYSCGNWMF